MVDAGSGRLKYSGRRIEAVSGIHVDPVERDVGLKWKKFYLVNGESQKPLLIKRYIIVDLSTYGVHDTNQVEEFEGLYQPKREAVVGFMKCQSNRDSSRRTINKFIWHLGFISF